MMATGEPSGSSPAVPSPERSEAAERSALAEPAERADRATATAAPAGRPVRKVVKKKVAKKRPATKPGARTPAGGATAPPTTTSAASSRPPKATRAKRGGKGTRSSIDAPTAPVPAVAMAAAPPPSARRSPEPSVPSVAPEQRRSPESGAPESGAPEPWRPWSPPPTGTVVVDGDGDTPGDRRAPEAGPRPTAAPDVPLAERGITDWVGRLLVQPDAQGPRMRIGVLWFVLLVPAAWFGVVWIAALSSVVATVAALQARMIWARLGYWASRALAAPAAFALPWLAVIDVRIAGAFLVVLPVLALVRSAMTGPPRRRVSMVATAGVTLRCAVAPGLAALGMVMTGHTGPASAVVLVVLVSAYDLGCFLFGAESSPVTGIIGGVICTMALAAPIWAFQFPPFDGRSEGFIYAGLVAVSAPLGQLMASLALPTAATWAPALRRLDTYIVAAPLWAWSLSSYLS